LLANKSSIHEEIKRRQKSGNSYYHSLQNLLTFSFLSKHIKAMIWKAVNLPVTLYGCQLGLKVFREEGAEKVILAYEGRGNWVAKKAI
jgi:hypothetical protein